MRRQVVWLVVAIIGSALPGLGGVAAAQQSATQVVTFQVRPISEIAVSGTVAPLVVNTAVAGSSPSSMTASGTSYAITANEGNRKIVASLDRAMPTDVDLAITLAAPAGATSAGQVSLTTTGVDAVVGVGPVSQAGLAISYTLSATPAAGVVPADTRVVTLTIVASP